MEISTHRTMDPKDAAAMVELMVRLQKPIMIHGSPGIGKSDIVHQVGKKLGRPVYDIRLLLMTEVDVRGIPYFNSDAKRMEWAPPAAFPLDEDSEAIIFLDEITQAPPSVQAAALQLVLNRRIGEFELPKKVSLVAAGNRTTDKTGAKAMIKALANRFLHVYLDAPFKPWQEWAMANNVHPDIVGFLSHKSHFLNTFNPSSPEDAFATPRTWVFFVSDILNSGLCPDNLLADAIAGSVGQGVATEFVAIRKMLTRLPHPDDILSGKVTTLDYKEVAGQYSLVTSINYRLKEHYTEAQRGDMALDDWYDMADNFLGFATDNLEPEIIVMAISVAINNFKLPFNHLKMPNYKKFFTKYSHLFKGMYS